MSHWLNETWPGIDQKIFFTGQGHGLGLQLENDLSLDIFLPQIPRLGTF